MTPNRILIVEDEALLARDLACMLVEMGREVAGIAATAEEACSLAAVLTPDLILMDIRLRGPADGIDAARNIRDGLGLPIVFVTAHNDEGTLRRAREAHPLGFLFKPFEESELARLLEQIEAPGTAT